MIEVDAVRKRFGAVVAVDGVSFVAPDGEVTGLLGPNGAGKTTTLRMLCGLVAPDAGTVRVDGLSATTQAPEARARIGVLTDARGLYPRMTAREHVRYFGELHGLRGPDLEARVEHLAASLEMAPLLDRRTEGMSTGERVKVAIARALVHDPRNVLLDEPTNGLDVTAALAMRRLVRRLRDEGRCVVLCSHVMQEVAALCDRLVIVARGRVVASGSPDHLRASTGKATLEEAFVAAIGGAEVST